MTMSLSEYSTMKFNGKHAMACPGKRHDQQYMEAADPVNNGAPAPQPR